MNFHTVQNRRVWDERVRRRAWHTEPATEMDFQNPLAAVDDCGWLGGNVRGLAMRTIEASMDDLSMLPAAGFDLVLQPVSTCYVPDIVAVYREVARVTAPGGLYISQHKQPASSQAEVLPSPRGGYTVTEPYYRNGPLPEAVDGLQHREAGTAEFLHRWSELLGGLCRNGFAIEDLVEPRHADPKAEPGTFAHRCCYLPPFVTVKARRAETGMGLEKPRLWTPLIIL